MSDLSRSAPPWGSAAPAVRHRGPVRTRRRVGRVVVSGALVVLLAVATAAGYEYLRLNRNIHSDPLFAGVAGNAGTEKADPFGHTPINILVIGSDARNNAVDCKIGHDCGSGAVNADVELLVHVAADRSNATVMSIPRDTVTQLAACRSPHTGRVTPARYGQINSTLASGPGCTVAAVHELTGVPIDHFAMIDFAGVVSMSDAVGGVPVCVDNDVYDPYSHLKLTRGTHVLKGLAALEFVRSRHAFGDGSDLGRTYAQHLFLASMIRTLRRSGVILDPATLLSLADAATKALTVDDGLGSIPRLLGLATDVNKVPPQRIVFTTMPTSPDPADPNRVVPASSARSLFTAILDDRALTRAGSSPSPTAPASASPGAAATAAPATDLAQITVRVLNGSGVTGRAAAVSTDLVAHGFGPRTSSGTAAVTARTTVRYPTGHLAQAEALAGYLHLPRGALRPGHGGTLVLTIGQDWPDGQTYPATGGAGSPGGPTPAATAPAGSHAQTADQPGSCATVSTARTVALGGIPMTPTQAYHRATSVPDSAP